MHIVLNLAGISVSSFITQYMRPFSKMHPTKCDRNYHSAEFESVSFFQNWRVSIMEKSLQF